VKEKKEIIFGITQKNNKNNTERESEKQHPII